jgi:hypothetical protein
MKKTWLSLYVIHQNPHRHPIKIADFPLEFPDYHEFFWRHGPPLRPPITAIILSKIGATNRHASWKSARPRGMRKIHKNTFSLLTEQVARIRTNFLSATITVKRQTISCDFRRLSSNVEWTAIFYLLAGHIEISLDLIR